ncbi:hypothetical protein BDR26DRAFT_354440 [Obelidium mucronatum]|nr:hypothetical protein BDR26DRAFT_354440 [Obelidium mucronatum]
MSCLSAGKSLSFENVFTLINVLILSGNVCCLGYNFCYLSRTFVRWVDIQRCAVSIFASFFYAAIEFLYVRYAWARSNDIVRRQFKSLFPSILRYVGVFPYLLALQFLSSVLVIFINTPGTYYAFYIANGGNGLTVVCFDILLLSSFVSFLNSTHLENETTREDFKIISQCGIISTLICFLMVATFVGSAIVGITLEDVLYSVIGLLMSFVFLVFAVMKIFVFHVVQNDRSIQSASWRGADENGTRCDVASIN